MQCWYPLGGRGYTSELLSDSVIREIAKAHGVSSAQVILTEMEKLASLDRNEKHDW